MVDNSDGEIKANANGALESCATAAAEEEDPGDAFEEGVFLAPLLLLDPLILTSGVICVILGSYKIQSVQLFK